MRQIWRARRILALQTWRVGIWRVGVTVRCIFSSNFNYFSERTSKNERYRVAAIQNDRSRGPGAPKNKKVERATKNDRYLELLVRESLFHTDKPN